MPRLDMVTGLYFLTTEIPGDNGRGPWSVYARRRGEHGDGPRRAVGAGQDQGAAARLRAAEDRGRAGRRRGWKPGDAWTAETTLGRVMFNELLPHGYPFINEQMHKKVQAPIINDLAERYPMIVVAQTVDKLKDAGFYWATRSGVTVSMADVLVPPKSRRSSTATRRKPTGSKRSTSAVL